MLGGDLDLPSLDQDVLNGIQNGEIRTHDIFGLAAAWGGDKDAATTSSRRL